MSEVDALAETAKKNIAHVSHNSGNNEWYTPANIIELARSVLGGIDLDPASSAKANEIVKASRYYTAEDDGLSKTWAGRVWMNPPYASDLVRRFTEKLLQELSEGNVEDAIVLVNNATETKWFQAMLHAASAICFPASRIKYFNSTLVSKFRGLQGQAILYFGNHTESFDRFKEIGGVVYCYPAKLKGYDL